MRDQPFIWNPAAIWRKSLGDVLLAGTAGDRNWEPPPRQKNRCNEREGDWKSDAKYANKWLRQGRGALYAKCSHRWWYYGWHVHWFLLVFMILSTATFDHGWYGFICGILWMCMAPFILHCEWYLKRGQRRVLNLDPQAAALTPPGSAEVQHGEAMPDEDVVGKWMHPMKYWTHLKAKA